MTTKSRSPRRCWQATWDVLQLTCLGYGAVVSGDFFGWQFGLTVGGTGGLLVAVVLVAIMYGTLCFAIRDLVLNQPPSDLGLAGYVAPAFGDHAAFLCGLAAALEYLLASMVVASGIAAYVVQFSGAPVWSNIVIVAAAYLVSCGINCAGAAAALIVAVINATLSLVVLLVGWLGAATVWRSDLLAPWFVGGAAGAVRCVPSAVWLFLAVEETPLAAGSVRHPHTALPRALTLAIAGLSLSAVATVVLFSGVPPGGAAVVGASDAPYTYAVRAAFGDATGRVLGAVAVVGLATSFHAVVFAAGHQLAALADASLLPSALAGPFRPCSPSPPAPSSSALAPSSPPHDKPSSPLPGRPPPTPPVPTGELQGPSPDDLSTPLTPPIAPPCVHHARTPQRAIALVGLLGAGTVAALRAADLDTVAVPALMAPAVMAAMITYVCTCAAHLRLRVPNPSLTRGGPVLSLLLQIAALGCLLSDRVSAIGMAAGFGALGVAMGLRSAALRWSARQG